jgi:uncharacterized protein
MNRMFVASVAAVIAFCPAISFAQTAPEPEAKRLALATEVITLGFPVEKRAEMFRGVIDSIRSQMKAANLGGNDDPEVQKITDRFVQQLIAKMQPSQEAYTPKLFGAMARAYAREFTQEELQEIRDFVAKPAGQKYFTRSPAALSDPDVAAVNTEYFAQVSELMRNETPKLTAELMAHLEAKKTK